MPGENKQVRGPHALNYTTSALKPKGEWRPTPPSSPKLEWREREGKLLPFSLEFNDFYSSCEGSVEEATYVFVNGNRLDERVTKNSELRVAELGFGFGLNFLTTAYYFAKACQEDERPVSRSWLSFTSFERHLPLVSDFRQFYSQLQLPDDFSQSLFEELSEATLRQLPENTAGAHRISLFDNRIRLTLFLGEASEFLPQSEDTVDAWYLDGFTPSRNSSLWSESLLQEVARLSTRGTTVSSYTSASKVRKQLSSFGFDIKKRKGFGTKREMLFGEYRGDSLQKKARNSNQNKKQVCIVGGGLAGVSSALSLLARGFKVSLLERNTEVANEASGNLAAVVMAYLSAKPDFLSRFYLNGFQHSLRCLGELEHLGLETTFSRTGVLRLTSSKRLASVLEALETLQLPTTIVRQAGAELEELGINSESLLFPMGGHLEIKTLCKSIVRYLQERYASNFTLLCHSNAIELQENSHSWSLFDGGNKLLAEADVVVLANAFDAGTLIQSSWLPMEKVRGEVIHVPANKESREITRVICADSYFTPAHEGYHLIGASYEHGTENTETSVAQQQKLLSKIGRWSKKLQFSSEEISSGRVSFRSMSPDRLPMIGSVANRENFETHYKAANDGKYGDNIPRTGLYPGLFCSVAHGSRGTISCFLAAEIVASEICGESAPLEADLLRAIHPSRFLLRATRRS